MLDIFKLNKKKINSKIFKHVSDDYLWNSRHIPSANREWNNSIFYFNSNNKLLLPSLDVTILKIIKSYFNMYSRYMERKVRFPYIKKWKRRFKIRRFWISKGEMKHTNDRVIITLYIYNGQYNKLLKKLKRLKLKIYSKKNWRSKFNKIMFYLNNMNKEIYTELYKSYNNLNINIYYVNVLKYIIKKCLRREIMYLRYKQIILFNKQKFTNNLLLPLKKLLTMLYNKKVEFNIISLKSFYLNSNIMSQIILTKIRRKRRKTLKILRCYIRKVKTPILNDRIFIREKNKIIGLNNEKITKFILNNINKNKKLHKTDEFLKKTYQSQHKMVIDQKYSKKDLILSEIKHKILSGVRLEASGRLTRRITAARSIYKFRYKGSLKNIDSTYKGLSTVMLRGNTKSNVQYTVLKSRTRIGAFGFKGWISGY